MWNILKKLAYSLGRNEFSSLPLWEKSHGKLYNLILQDFMITEIPQIWKWNRFGFSSFRTSQHLLSTCTIGRHITLQIAICTYCKEGSCITWSFHYNFLSSCKESQTKRIPVAFAKAMQNLEERTKYEQGIQGQLFISGMFRF